MKSPFPGMDPYLESHWRDIHHRLITYACDSLAEGLPADLRARVEERVSVEVSPDARRSVYPDVRVLQRPGSVAEEREGGVAVAEPLVLPVEDEPATEGFIQIVDVASGGRVVTVIEVLSRSNKEPGPGQDLYLRKQRELIEGGVNLVEIDLLRSDQRVLAIPVHKIPASHRTAYQVCVSRATRRGSVELYAVPLRQRLPVFRVPLRAADADATLDLQALLERCYKNGGYDDIDYRRPPEPALDPDDAAWAEQLLAAAGRR